MHSRPYALIQPRENQFRENPTARKSVSRNSNREKISFEKIRTKKNILFADVLAISLERVQNQEFSLLSIRNIVKSIENFNRLLPYSNMLQSEVVFLGGGTSTKRGDPNSKKIGSEGTLNSKFSGPKAPKVLKNSWVSREKLVLFWSFRGKFGSIL